MSKSKVWYVTKYALTAGVYVCNEAVDHNDGYVSVVWKGGLNNKLFLVKQRDAFETLEEAEKKVRDMIEGKRKSVQKTLDKLRKVEENLNKKGVVGMVKSR